jgi:hypothetical protein
MKALRSCRIRSRQVIIASAVAGVLGIMYVGAAPSASAISGTFLPIVISNGCSLTSGFTVSGSSVCGVNAQTTGQRYIYLPSAGSSITYSFTVPSGGSETLTYGIPAGGYLNNVNATVSVDGGAAETVGVNEGGFGSSTTSDLPIWNSEALGPGAHTWTITSTGDAVNVYGLWVGSSSLIPIAGTLLTAPESGSSWTYSDQGICSGSEDCTIVGIGVNTSDISLPNGGGFSGQVSTEDYDYDSCQAQAALSSVMAVLPTELLQGCFDAQVGSTALGDLQGVVNIVVSVVTNPPPADSCGLPPHIDPILPDEPIDIWTDTGVLLATGDVVDAPASEQNDPCGTTALATFNGIPASDLQFTPLFVYLAQSAGSEPVTVAIPPSGALTVSVAPGTAALTQSGSTATGNLPDVTVSDTRNTYPGWSVSAQVSAFTGSGTAAGSTISGDQLGWVPVAAGPLVGGATLGPAVAPGTSPGGLGDTSAVLAEASPGFGFGTNTLGADLTLDIPAAALAGPYTASLTITYIETGP